METTNVFFFPNNQVNELKLYRLQFKVSGACFPFAMPVRIGLTQRARMHLLLFTESYIHHEVAVEEGAGT